MEKSNQSAIKTVLKRNPITVDKEPYDGLYPKEGVQQAQLRQVIDKEDTYPSSSVTNNLDGNIFDISAFTEMKGQVYTNKEPRVIWLPVPTGTTKAKLEAMLAAKPEACIYKMLSNHPILSDDDKRAIKNIADATMDRFAKSQLVVYPSGHEDAGSPILDPNNKVQYRRLCFSPVLKEDIDLRTPETLDYYATPETEALLNDEIPTISSPEQSILADTMESDDEMPF